MKKVGKSIKVYFIGMVIGGITLGLTTVVADTIINSTNVSYKTSTVKAALDDLYGLTADDIWQKIYPIGSIYTSVSPTSPATLFGGTWERFGKGKSLVSVDEENEKFQTVEKTGGSSTKTIAVGNLPAHSHSVNAVNTGTQSANHTHSMQNHTHTTNIGSHSHTVGVHANTSEYTSGFAGGVIFAGRIVITGAGSINSSSTNIGNKTSGGPSNNNTGANSANHSHQVPAHNTNNTGSGTALDVQNPYITVYMWKRTA